MLFSGPVFLFLFLPLLLLLYRIPGRRWRNSLLLASSLFLYVWEERGWVLLLIASVVVNQLCAAWVQRDLERGASGRAGMWTAVVFDVLLLATLKYADFLWRNAIALLDVLGIESPVRAAPPWGSALHLPIGISFYTFQAISFVVDVRRRQARTPRHALDFALYLTAFPQLLAGPIVRYRDVAGQLLQRSETWSDLAAGVRRFAIGLGKKVLVADVLAATADGVFGLPPENVSAPALWLGTLCFWGQIYFDFSGYSDMAIGLGRMFGFRFPENFRHPYAAASMSDFWRRWHVTLSSWFLDYVWFPLIGRRPGPARIYASLIAVLTLCGLWHGAAWTFVGVGFLHGILLALERAGLARLLQRLPLTLRVLYVNLFVCLCWVLFRSPDAGHAVDVWRGLAGLRESGAGLLPAARWIDAPTLLALAAAILGAFPWLPALERWRRSRAERGDGRVVLALDALAACAVLALLLVSATEIAAGTHRPFLYFRF